MRKTWGIVTLIVVLFMCTIQGAWAAFGIDDVLNPLTLLYNVINGRNAKITQTGQGTSGLKLFYPDELCDACKLSRGAGITIGPFCPGESVEVIVTDPLRPDLVWKALLQFAAPQINRNLHGVYLYKNVDPNPIAFFTKAPYMVWHEPTPGAVFDSYDCVFDYGGSNKVHVTLIVVNYTLTSFLESHNFGAALASYMAKYPPYGTHRQTESGIEDRRPYTIQFVCEGTDPFHLTVCDRLFSNVTDVVNGEMMGGTLTKEYRVTRISDVTAGVDVQSVYFYPQPDDHTVEGNPTWKVPSDYPANTPFVVHVRPLPQAQKKGGR